MDWVEVTTEDELGEIVGQPSERAVIKERDRLTELDRRWLAASPFCVVATADADGRCDASPKGDPAGHLVHVIDERTIALAERKGNRRVDGYRNILANPHVGLDFLIPGRGDTLRINGRARIVREASFMDEMAINGARPVLVLLVEVETVFFHCAKAFLRSKLWKPETWDPQGAVPRRAVLAAELERLEGETLAELDDYYGPSYADKLY